MKTMRNGLIQTWDQLKFTFGAIKSIEEEHFVNKRKQNDVSNKKRKHSTDNDSDQDKESPNPKKVR